MVKCKKQHPKEHLHMANETKSNPHAGHRERMRARFEKEGADHFDSHQLLEMYLFSALPRCDTNEIAHRLIARFGSLEEVFLAEHEDLIQVEGISHRTASTIKLTAAIMRRMAIESYHPPKKYDRFEDIVRYLKSIYTGITVERVYLLLFDNGMKMLDCVLLDEGTVNQANINARKIMEHAIKKNASSVLLAHNHPRGVAIPSSEDIATTNFMYNNLQSMGLTLIDHVIVGKETIMPILNRQQGNLRPSPITGKIDEDFYRGFYGRFDERNKRK
jgi:DNA repair protein RadC